MVRRFGEKRGADCDGLWAWHVCYTRDFWGLLALISGPNQAAVYSLWSREIGLAHAGQVLQQMLLLL
jgi:hypothetical protein